MDAYACFILSCIPFLIPIPLIWASLTSRNPPTNNHLRKLALLSLLTGGFWSIAIVALTDKFLPNSFEPDRRALTEIRSLGWAGVALFCVLGIALFQTQLS